MASTSFVNTAGPQAASGDWWGKNAPNTGAVATGPGGVQAFAGGMNTATQPGGVQAGQPGNVTPQAGSSGGGAPSGGYSFQIPPGFDPNNPADKLVLDQFQEGIKNGNTDAGSQPTAENMNYWKTQIQQTGGATPDNLGYWTNRMQSGQGKGANQGGSAGGGPAGSYQLPAGAGFAPYTPPTFTPPANYVPPTFTAPTGLTMENDPGYQERLKMGTDALQASAAAKGSVLSGGTLKAIDKYSQDYASNEFGNVYNRALGTFDTNAALGMQAYDRNTANAWRGQEDTAQYGLAGYQTNVNTQRGAQQDYWQRLQDLYSGGLNATQSGYVAPPA